MTPYRENPWDKENPWKENPEDIVRNLKARLKLNISPKIVFPLIIVILILVFLSGAFYTIETDERGVILRFGKYSRSTGPGLHFKLPFGIEKVYPVKVKHIFKEEFGFRTKSAGVRTAYEESSYNDESLMLTGDLNVLDVEWIVQFKINDPYKALFRLRNLRKTLRDISESIMRKVIGDYTFNEALTEKRVEINSLVQEQMQEILNSYDAGIKIVTVKLQDVNPPDPVKPAFNEVNEAKQERERMINQAWEVYNRKIPQAKGEALKTIKEAEGYALEKINTAEGDTKRFSLILKEYENAKDVTRRRLYLEYMSSILQKAGKKYIIDPEVKTIIPFLNLGDEKQFKQ